MLPVSAPTRRRALIALFSFSTACAFACVAWPASANQRALETAYGKVVVTGEPQRVVTLDEGALDTVLAVGMQPVGSIAARGATGLPDYLQNLAKDVAIVGNTREPNLEAIFAQRPDLILAPPGLEKRIYDLLSKMAPTIVPSTTTTAPWRERNALYVEALGKSDVMRKRLQSIDERITNLRSRLKPGQSFSVVRWNPQGPIAMSAKLITGQLLTAIGMKSTDLAAGLGDRPHSDTLSLENLGRIDADWLFIATLNEQGEATLEAARKQPAFTRLGAVRGDRVVMVDGQVWTSATGLLAALKILSDIERVMLK